MRIAVSARLLIPGKLEGIGRYSYEILKRMVVNHPDDEFILITDKSITKELIFPPNTQIVKVGWLPARHAFLFLYWFEGPVYSALKKLEADVFLTPDSFLSLRSKVPAVQVIHDIAWAHYPKDIGFWNRWYYKIMMPLFARKASSIITVSKYSEKDIINQLNVPSSKITITGNGCSDLFKPVNELVQMEIRKKYSDQRDYFLYVGALHPRKNILNLIEAFNRYKKNTGSSMKLVLSGRMAWKIKTIQKALDSGPFAADIMHLGFVPDEDLPDLIGSAFAMVYVSNYEGFGIPILEAMYADVPVITSNITSMPEVIGDAGLTVNPTDPDEIAEAMEKLRTNISLYNTLVEKGRTQRQQFNWEDYSRQVYDVLKKAAYYG